MFTDTVSNLINTNETLKITPCAVQRKAGRDPVSLEMSSN